MSNEEIRVMTLVRKPSLDRKYEDNSTVKRYYTTDYFDVLITQEQGLDVPLNQWINGDSGLVNDYGETAVQRYSLYFNNRIYTKYEENQQELKRGNPFEDNEDLKFLSVIQVYISPEILRRIKDKKKMVWSKHDEGLLDIFLSDLYDILEIFSKNYREQDFVYRIYHALSAGDFAVIVKSRTPELSFGMASYIRSRVSEQYGRKWAVYKTYTLLAFENEIDDWEKDTKRLFKQDKSGKFVLRGCYSWTYWAEKGTIRDIEGIDRLNGRYDISAELTEQEFEKLYNKLVREQQGAADADSCELGKMEYLSWLIANKYLSYINERYLMGGVELNSEGANINSLIELEDKNKEELYISNKDYIEQLRKKQIDLEAKCENVCKEHKILRHYFGLLKRQVVFCCVLNEQSDTQIYAAGMGRMLDVVFENLNKYNKIYNEENEAWISGKEFNRLGELIVRYVGKAVYAINTYMEYVRNNNLQSLQTPNYNIESDMGMEKILIGYGEYLREFIKFYLRRNKECMNDKKEYLPIVVPNMDRLDINVEALFSDSKVINLASETEKEMDKKLLIIYSPSMMELEDIPMAMAMLCHEVAHQFRYEQRQVRNEVLVRLFAEECARVITNELIDDFQTEEEVLITFPKIMQILKNCLAEMIQEFLTEEDSEYKVTVDAPLDYLTLELGENLLRFFGDFKFTSKLGGYLELFIKQTCGQAEVNAVDVDAVKNLYDLANADNFPEYEDIVRAVYAYMDELESIGEIVPENYIYLDELTAQLEGEDKIRGNCKNTDKYITYLYERLTAVWKERSSLYKENVQKSISVDDYRMWALTGRYFGIDTETVKDTQMYEGNRKKFLDRLKHVRVEEEDVHEAGQRIGIYREITSDIFMCCVMNLSVFSYLNIVVTNMWAMDVVTNPGAVERIITVSFIIAAAGESEKKQALERYKAACIQVLETLEDEVKRILPEERESFRAVVNGAAIFLDDDKIKNTYNGELEIFRRQLVDKYGYKDDILIKVDKMLQICDVLFEKGEICIEQLYERDYLKEDYFRGYKILSAFREEMKTDNKMKRLRSLNDSISAYLERLYETGKVRDAELNRKSVEFLLRMYYNYKFRNADDEVDLV